MEELVNPFVESSLASLAFDANQLARVIGRGDLGTARMLLHHIEIRINEVDQLVAESESRQLRLVPGGK